MNLPSTNGNSVAPINPHIIEIPPAEPDAMIPNSALRIPKKKPPGRNNFRPGTHVFHVHFLNAIEIISLNLSLLPLWSIIIS